MSHLAAKLRLLLLGLSLSAGFVRAEQPNIILLMADDHGKWATGTYGDERIRTPNLDHLADTGVRFDAAISNSPVCSPARASFYTGLIPSQHGVHDFIRDADPYDRKGRLDGIPLISEKLKDVGYQVGLFGKWHADGKGWEPVRGFDRWVSYDRRETNWSNQYEHSGTVHFSVDGEVLLKTEMQAWFLTESALDFIDEADGKPFFTCVNFVEPHSPFVGLPDRLAEYYRKIARELVPYGDNAWLDRTNGKEGDIAEHEEWVAQYLAAVTLLDEQIGRLLDGLQARGLLENTVIIYTSDHGHMTGQYGLYGKANASLPQNLLEESLDIPLVISGPAEYVRAGQVRSEFVNLVDLHETIVDWAHEKAPATKGPGRSISPLLLGERSRDWRTYQFAEHGTARMVSNGHWKLVRYYLRDDAEPIDYWFDLANPRGERQPSFPPAEALQNKLKEELEFYFSRYETPESSGRTIWEQERENPNEPWIRMQKPPEPY